MGGALPLGAGRRSRDPDPVGPRQMERVVSIRPTGGPTRSAQGDEDTEARRAICSVARGCTVLPEASQAMKERRNGDGPRGLLVACMWNQTRLRPSAKTNATQPVATGSGRPALTCSDQPGGSLR